MSDDASDDPICCDDCFDRGVRRGKQIAERAMKAEIAELRSNLRIICRHDCGQRLLSTGGSICLVCNGLVPLIPSPF